jgi:uncharacterized protein involved in exopolysaccharide biosynthesis
VADNRQEVTIGMSDYMAAVRRRRKLAAYVGLPIVFVAAMIAFALPKTYRSSVNFKLRDTSPESIRMSFSDQYVYNLRDSVLNGSNLQEAVQKIQPYPEYHDNPGLQAGLIASNTKVTMQTGTILDAGGHDMAINTGFEVTYENRDPQKAHEVANWLAETFTRGQRQEAEEKAGTQSKFFSAEADRTGARVAELEAKLAEFKKQNFAALPESAQTNLMAKNQAEQELLNVQREITAQQQNRLFIASQLQTAQVNSTAGGAMALEDEYKRKLTQYDASHPDMVALRRQISIAKKGGSLSADGSLQSELDEKRQTLAEARQRYGEEYPDVKRLMREVKSLEQRIASGEKFDPGAGIANTPAIIQLNTQLRSTDTQLGSLQVRRAELQNKMATVQQQLAASPIVQREYEMLVRDLDTAKQQYQELLKQRMNIEVNQSAIKVGNADKFVQVGPAWLPDRPYKPNRPVIISLGLFAGFMLALVAAVGAEMLDSRVRGSKDIGTLLDVTPMAIIPQIQNSRSRLRSRRELSLITASAVVGIPVAFFVIRLMVR